MQQYLERKLKPYRSFVEFTGAVPQSRIPEILSKTDICVFPSWWDNFPYVCLEAMAAGRCIVGSSSGGMSEMLALGLAGRLVPPRQPQQLATAIIELLNDPAQRMALGQAARNRLLAEYNTARIGALQEASYRRAIQRRQAAGSRLSQVAPS